MYFQIKGFTIRILNIPLTLQLTPSGGTKPISKRFSARTGLDGSFTCPPASARHVSGRGESFACLCLLGQVSRATLFERFWTKCLRNHLNLQLPFLKLEAVIAEVKKCSPWTHDSQINSLLVWKEGSQACSEIPRPPRLCACPGSVVLCSSDSPLPTVYHPDKMWGLWMWKHEQFHPWCFVLFFSPLYIKTDKINPNANWGAQFKGLLNPCWMCICLPTKIRISDTMEGRPAYIWYWMDCLNSTIHCSLFYQSLTGLYLFRAWLWRSLSIIGYLDIIQPFFCIKPINIRNSPLCREKWPEKSKTPG